MYGESLIFKLQKLKKWVTDRYQQDPALDLYARRCLSQSNVDGWNPTPLEGKEVLLFSPLGVACQTPLFFNRLLAIRTMTGCFPGSDF